MLLTFYMLFCVATFLSFLCCVYMVFDRINQEGLRFKNKSSKITGYLNVLLVIVFSMIPIINIILFSWCINYMSKSNELTLDELKEKFKLEEWLIFTLFFIDIIKPIW